VDYLIGRIVDPLLMPLHAGERVYWLYLASGLAFAAAAYLVRRARKSCSLRGLARYLLPRKVLLHRSALLDYRFFVVNRIVFGLLMLPAAPAAALGAAAVTAALLGTIAVFPGGSPFGVGVIVLQTLLSALALDLGLFLAHRLQHAVPLLWEFHKVHHSAEVLTPVSAYRMHPVDDLLSVTLGGALGGMVAGVFQWLDPGNPGPLLLLGLHAAVFLYYLAGFNLRHSHVWIDYPRWLGRVLISPAQHQIHHSAAPCHAGKNLGFIFAFWDAACGTLWRPARRERLRFGLAGDETPQYSSIRRLYFLPFSRAFGGAGRPLQLALLLLLIALTVALSFAVAYDAARVTPSALPLVP
jgi:sterol desaturase/sphingolipid hydroxylase (fatty acid hydroxylase superfamily)